MSHVAKYSIQLKNANMYITKNTAELMIKKFGCVSIHSFTDLFGNTHKVKGVGIRYKGLSIDVQVENGELKFLCDKFQKEEVFAEVLPIFKQNYHALAAAQALKDIGYSVTVHEDKGKIKIPAMKEGSGGESINIEVGQEHQKPMQHELRKEPTQRQTLR